MTETQQPTILEADQIIHDETPYVLLAILAGRGDIEAFVTEAEMLITPIIAQALVSELYLLLDHCNFHAVPLEQIRYHQSIPGYNEDSFSVGQFIRENLREAAGRYRVQGIANNIPGKPDDNMQRARQLENMLQQVGVQGGYRKPSTMPQASAQ